MSNLLGKSLLELKKIGRTIADSAVDIGSAVGEAAVNITDHAKKSANLAIEKAEMDELYYKLGKSVFEEGLHPDNEEAMSIMDALYQKHFLIESLEDELNDSESDCDCDRDEDELNDSESVCDCDCDKNDDCSCDLKDVVNSENVRKLTSEDIEALKKYLGSDKG